MKRISYYFTFQAWRFTLHKNMKCPFCTHLESKVLESRLSKEGDILRRRRECEKCQRRYTTYERVEEVMPLIVKKDGRREGYERSKIINGFLKACEKRSVPIETIEKTTNQIEAKIMELGEREISSSIIGEQIMEQLKKLDNVAYVRFASVYRSFQDMGEFVDLIKNRKKEEKSSI